MNQLDEFVKYFMKFYGPEGIYKDCHGEKRIEPLDVVRGVALMLIENPGHEFDGDSIDREKVLKTISGVIA